MRRAGNLSGEGWSKLAALAVALFALALFVLVATANPAEAQQTQIVDKSVTVPESSHGVDTLVDIKSGDRLVMTAGGEISPAFLFPSTGPNGYNEANCANLDYPAPCERKYSLIGRVGNGSPYFFV